MGDQPIDRAALEEARLMSLISGAKPKPVVIKTTPVEATSPRNQTSTQNARSQFYSSTSPRNEPPVNRQPEVVNRVAEPSHEPRAVVVEEPDIRPSECLTGQHTDPHSTHNYAEADAETKLQLESERIVKAASRSLIKKVVALPTIERGPLSNSFILFIILFMFFIYHASHSCI